MGNYTFSRSKTFANLLSSIFCLVICWMLVCDCILGTTIFCNSRAKWKMEFRILQNNNDNRNKINNKTNRI